MNKKGHDIDGQYSAVIQNFSHDVGGGYWGVFPLYYLRDDWGDPIQSGIPLTLIPSDVGVPSCQLEEQSRMLGDVSRVA